MGCCLTLLFATRKGSGFKLLRKQTNAPKHRRRFDKSKRTCSMALLMGHSLSLEAWHVEFWRVANMVSLRNLEHCSFGHSP